jgi:transcriptional regulator with XRE-family HTH domain
MPQKELAARLDMDPSPLARWERDERVPTSEFLRRVRAVLDAYANGLVRALRRGAIHDL